MDQRTRNQERRRLRKLMIWAPTDRGPFCNGCNYFVKLDDPKPCPKCSGWTGPRKKLEPLPPVRPPRPKRPA